MKKILMILLACLCLAGCSSNSASKVLKCEIEGTPFTITEGKYSVMDDNAVSLNFKLKNNSEEKVFDYVKLYFVLLNEKEEEVCEASFDYEQLEKGKELEAKSWAFPTVILSQEIVDGSTTTKARSLKEDDFSALKLKAILIDGKDYTELENPVIIQKADMNKVDK